MTLSSPYYLPLVFDTVLTQSATYRKTRVENARDSVKLSLTRVITTHCEPNTLENVGKS